MKTKEEYLALLVKEEGSEEHVKLTYLKNEEVK